jgi:AraC-like DNA-binding protein
MNKSQKSTRASASETRAKRKRELETPKLTALERKNLEARAGDLRVQIKERIERLRSAKSVSLEDKEILEAIIKKKNSELTAIEEMLRVDNKVSRTPPPIKKGEDRTMPSELDLYLAGLSIAQLSRQLGLSRYLVIKKLKEQGCLAPGKRSYSPLTGISDKELLALYGSGLTTRAIAESLGVSFSAVGSRLRRIPGYSPRPSHYLGRQVLEQERLLTVSLRLEESIAGDGVEPPAFRL